jgi:hypothetical protein
VLHAAAYRRILLATSALLLLSAPGCRRAPAGPPSLPVTSSFLQNDEGWTVVGDGNLFHSPTGGNPGSTGYIFAIDRVQGDIFYFNAPGKFLGNLSEAYGRLLTFDLLWQENSPGGDKEGDDIILAGGSRTLVAALPQRPGNTWTSYAVRLDPTAAWIHRVSREPASAADIQAVLASLQQLRIRGEFRHGAEVGSLDNVRLGVTQ